MLTRLLLLLLFLVTRSWAFSQDGARKFLLTEPVLLHDKGTESIIKVPTQIAVLSRRSSTKQLQARLDKGFNLLEVASGFVPQGKIVQTAKEGWKFAWKRMMAELAPQDETGSYQRPSYKFKVASPLDSTATGRYHLYTGNPCPWCHRTVLALRLLGIKQDQVGWTVLEDDPVKASRGGWVFSSTQPDPMGNTDLRALYDMLEPGYKGRCTAPLLVDKKARKIISNESSDIVRMLNGVTIRGKDAEAAKQIDLIPPDLKAEIEATNEWVYRLLNNGVYRCGFSTTQAAYDRAAKDVQEGLAKAEQVLSERPFLCGSTFTEADLRFLPTALRFDGAYAPLFRAGGAHLRIRDYPGIQAWLRRCWAMPGVPESIDLGDACGSYFKQLFPLNPGGIVPTSVTASSLGLE